MGKSSKPFNNLSEIITDNMHPKTNTTTDFQYLKMLIKKSYNKI